MADTLKSDNKSLIENLIAKLDFSNDAETSLLIDGITEKITQANQADVTEFRDQLIVKLTSRAEYEKALSSKVRNLSTSLQTVTNTVNEQAAALECANRINADNLISIAALKQEVEKLNQQAHQAKEQIKKS